MELERNDLLEYLKHVCELEHSLFEQSSLYNKINNRIYQLKNWQPIGKWSYETYLASEPILPPIMIFGYIFFACIGWVGVAFVEWIFTKGGHTPIANILFWVAIAILVIIKIVDVAKASNKKAEIEEKNENIKQKNKQIEYQNQVQTAANLEQAAKLEKQLKIIDRSYSKTKRVLDKFYELDVIYKKYRNMPAVFAFYEFIESERCQNLKGHEGAYNLYDDLLFKKMIFDKLDVIISNLNAIKNSQYLLYEAIQKSNNTTDLLIDRISNISGTLENIEKDEKLNLYYNRINSKNTEFIKDLHFYDKK